MPVQTASLTLNLPLMPKAERNWRIALKAWLAHRIPGCLSIVERHVPPEIPSMTSAIIAHYLEQVAREDSSSIFSTPSGSPRKLEQLVRQSLHDLEDEIGPTLLPQSRDKTDDPVPACENPNYGQADKTHDSGTVTVRARTGSWVREDRKREWPCMQLKAPTWVFNF